LLITNNLVRFYAIINKKILGSDRKGEKLAYGVVLCNQRGHLITQFRISDFSTPAVHAVGTLRGRESAPRFSRRCKFESECVRVQLDRLSDYAPSRARSLRSRVVPLRSPRPRRAIGFVVAPWLRRDTLFALGARRTCSTPVKLNLFQRRAK
jgi:hypothetical protein